MLDAFVRDLCSEKEELLVELKRKAHGASQFGRLTSDWWIENGEKVPHSFRLRIREEIPVELHQKLGIARTPEEIWKTNMWHWDDQKIFKFLETHNAVLPKNSVDEYVNWLMRNYELEKAKKVVALFSRELTQAECDTCVNANLEQLLKLSEPNNPKAQELIRASFELAHLNCSPEWKAKLRALWNVFAANSRAAFAKELRKASAIAKV